MAEVCRSCDRAFVFLAVVFTLLGTYLAEDIYFYASDKSSSDRHQFIQLRRHAIERRDVAAALSPAPPSVAQPNDAKKPYLPEKKGKKPTVTTTAGDAPRADAPTVKKNLGENGTGTLWENATAPPPPPPPKLGSTEAAVATPVLQLVNNDDGDDVFDDIATHFNKTVKEGGYYVNKTDAHIYYNSTFTTFPHIGKKYWVDFNASNRAVTHDLLSMSHRRAATVKLNFDFPFYGHMIRNVTVATGGFIYTGDYVHSWLAATQYIAPLMANFDTSLTNDSFIKFLDNGTSFTVQWENVRLQDKPDDGKFTFQATLHKNGDIVFAYANVPDVIDTIKDIYHPVTIGLSDAYIIDNAENYVHRKTIFEYHKVSFEKEEIKNSTVIYLTALPTCQQKKDCQSCLNGDDISFKCTWCPAAARCSNGVDRFRHEWLQKSCNKRQVSTASDCQALYTTGRDDEESFVDANALHHRQGPSAAGGAAEPKGSVGSVSSILLVALVCVSLVFALWTLYAYRNPHTTSGQILIRYRPSQWRWRRGEARYTAATIHM